jgi:hypothetical protein
MEGVLCTSSTSETEIGWSRRQDLGGPSMVHFRTQVDGSSLSESGQSDALISDGRSSGGTYATGWIGRHSQPVPSLPTWPKLGKGGK